METVGINAFSKIAKMAIQLAMIWRGRFVMRGDESAKNR